VGRIERKAAASPMYLFITQVRKWFFHEQAVFQFLAQGQQYLTFGSI